MADYSDPDVPLGGWENYRIKEGRKRAEILRRQRIDLLMEKVVIRLASGGQEYCDYCGSAVGPQYTGAHTSHKAWHLFLFETIFPPA